VVLGGARKTLDQEAPGYSLVPGRNRSGAARMELIKNGQPHRAHSSVHADSLFLNQRACLSDAALCQLSRDLESLIGEQVDLRLEGPVSGQRDLDAMFSGADEHFSPRSAKLMDVPHKGIIEEHRSPIR